MKNVLFQRIFSEQFAVHAIYILPLWIMCWLYWILFYWNQWIKLQMRFPWKLLLNITHFAPNLAQTDGPSKKCLLFDWFYQKCSERGHIQFLTSLSWQVRRKNWKNNHKNSDHFGLELTPINRSNLYWLNHNFNRLKCECILWPISRITSLLKVQFVTTQLFCKYERVAIRFTSKRKFHNEFSWLRFRRYIAIW